MSTFFELQFLTLLQAGCPYDDSDLLALQCLLNPSSSKLLKARAAGRQAIADEEENGCLILPNTPKDRRISVTTTCPLECGARYGAGSGGNYPGHRRSVRLGVVIKIIQTLETDGKDAALALLKKRDLRGKPYEVSHMCHARTDQVCIEPTHFEMESQATNARRKQHQNGHEVCDCASFGDRPCLVNGDIGVEVYDDDGELIGWKKKEGSKAGKRQRRN